MKYKFLILILIVIVVSLSIFTACVKDRCDEEKSFKISDKYSLLSQTPQNIKIYLTNYYKDGKSKNFEITEEDEINRITDILNSTVCYTDRAKEMELPPPGVGVYIELIYGEESLNFNCFALKVDDVEYFLDNYAQLKEVILELARNDEIN